jgi:ubiquinone/menaquinone biosynthesis methyltransferase
MSAAPPVQNGSGAMFDAIAARYDLVNRVISLGVDQSWRKKTVRSLNLRSGARVLDLATGTADLALMIASRVESSTVVGLDPSSAMLAVGQRKIDKKGLAQRISLVQGDAEALPFPDRSFDGVSIAFGIRNVPDRARALKEMARVTRPGGRIALLELSEPRKGPLASLALQRMDSSRCTPVRSMSTAWWRNRSCPVLPVRPEHALDMSIFMSTTPAPAANSIATSSDSMSCWTVFRARYS